MYSWSIDAGSVQLTVRHKSIVGDTLVWSGVEICSEKPITPSHILLYTIDTGYAVMNQLLIAIYMECVLIFLIRFKKKLNKMELYASAR